MSVGLAHLGDNRGAQDHVRGRNELGTAIRCPQHQTTVFVKRLKTSGQLAVRKAYAYDFAKTGSTGDPVGTYSRKAFTSIPLLQPSNHLCRK